MDKRYSALRLIAVAMKVLAAIVGTLTAISAIGVCATGVLSGALLDQFTRESGQDSARLGVLAGAIGGLFGTILPIFVGGGLTLILYAVGDAIFLQIAIEENTRSVARYFRHQSPSRSPAQVASPTAQESSLSTTVPSER